MRILTRYSWTQCASAELWNRWIRLSCYFNRVI